MNYSDHEDMNPFTSTQIHLFSHTVVGNLQPSFIVYTKMFSELIECAIFPSNPGVYSMHGSRLDKNDVYLSAYVCLMGDQAQCNSHTHGCLCSVPS